MRKEKKTLVSIFVAVLVMIGGLVSAGLSVSAREAESGGGSESISSSSGSSSTSSGKSSSSSSKSSTKSSTTKKVEDKASTGSFSTSTDSRRGATKAEDNGIDVNQGIDTNKVDDNGIDANQGVDDRNGATKAEDDGVVENKQFQGEDSVVHRSVVAEAVKQLNAVADREGGIGEQVRVIARQQNESKDRALEAIEKVEKRGNVVTFLFGVDTKTLKELRKEIELTRKNEKEIRKAAQEAEKIENKAVLEKQAEILKSEVERMEKIEAAHDEAFSLFGWVNNIFQ